MQNLCALAAQVHFASKTACFDLANLTSHLTCFKRNFRTFDTRLTAACMLRVLLVHNHQLDEVPNVALKIEPQWANLIFLADEDKCKKMELRIATIPPNVVRIRVAIQWCCSKNDWKHVIGDVILRDCFQFHNMEHVASFFQQHWVLDAAIIDFAFDFTHGKCWAWCMEQPRCHPRNKYACNSTCTVIWEHNLISKLMLMTKPFVRYLFFLFICFMMSWCCDVL